MEKKKHKRQLKNLLINKKFQLVIIGYFLILFVILTLIYFGANSYFFWKFNQLGINSGIRADHVFFRIVEAQRNSMNTIFLITSIASMVVIVVYGLVMSHKIAGPIYKVCDHIKNKKSGPISFRDGDFFPELAHAINSIFKKS